MAWKNLSDSKKEIVVAEIKALNCPNCGGSIPDTSKVCSFCGSRVILSDDRQKFVLAGTICPKCGLDNKEQHRFCSKCGEKLFKECPECKKEIGLDAAHCPFCGSNIANAAKEKEIAFANRANSIKQLQQWQHELQPLYEKLHPLSNECEKIERLIRDRRQTVEYGEVWWQFFLIVYPIGALILSAIAYLIGFRASFWNNFIISYLIIFVVLNWIPRMRLKTLENERDSLVNKMSVINREISKINLEITKHQSIITECNNKYR